jgi:NitT/TauT family transport system permease protein
VTLKTGANSQAPLSWMSDEADDPGEAGEAINPDRWTRVDIAISVTATIILLAGWEAAVRVYDVPQVVLPAPSQVLMQLWLLFASGIIWRHLGITLLEIVAGFALGAAMALLLGSLIAMFRVIDRIVFPYIVALQAVPKVAIAPLLIIWFGFGLQSKVLMTAVIAFFPVLVNTVVGLKSVEQDRLDLMTALDARRWQTFRYVRLPTALPFIFAGLDVSAVLSVIGAIVGEFVGATGGLGYLLLVNNADLRIATVFAILVVLAAIGITLHLLVLAAQRRVMFWSTAGLDRLVP